MKRSVHKRRASRVTGFTMLEVMAANALLGVGLAAVLAATSTMSNMFAHFENETAALSVADGFVEDLVLAPRASPDLQPGSYTKNVDELGNTQQNGPFTLSWTVEGATPIAGMRRITVDVSWTESGTTRRVRLQTARE